MTSKEKGNVALGQAIAFATANGMIVSLPLNDAQDYDVIFDNGTLLKVQVKYISGNVVDTRVRGHKDAQGNYYVKDRVEKPDYYFITTNEMVNYFIPQSFVDGKLTFTINKDYNGLIV